MMETMTATEYRAMKQPSEYQIQCDAVNLIERNYPDILLCASAGGMRSSVGTGVKMKASGYRKGFPDLFIYQPSGRYAGLAIEFKTVKGSLTPEQIVWGDRLMKAGYYWVVCRTADTALKWVSNYLNGSLI